TLRRINHTGNSDSDTFTRTDLFVITKDLLDTSRQLLDQNIDFAISLKTTDDAELSTHQIGDENVGSRRANIHTDHATLARVDEERRWTPASSHRFADSAFEDQRLTEEFANQQARDSASNVHEPREVSTGNRLMGTDEVQCNLPVD